MYRIQFSEENCFPFPILQKWARAIYDRKIDGKYRALSFYPWSLQPFPEDPRIDQRKVPDVLLFLSHLFSSLSRTKCFPALSPLALHAIFILIFACSFFLHHPGQGVKVPALSPLAFLHFCNIICTMLMSIKLNGTSSGDYFLSAFAVRTHGFILSTYRLQLVWTTMTFLKTEMQWF